MEEVEGEFYHSSVKNLLEDLNTTQQGLSSEEAKIRLQKYGKNEIEETEKFSALKVLWQEFNSFLIYILLISIAVLVGIDLYRGTSEHTLDAIVIGAIVVLNAGIGFAQQYKAEKAIQGLKKMIIPKSRVLRDGKVISVSSVELVPGDIIFLSSGDKISADARILKLDNLQTNEAILTGESEPVTKSTEVINKKTALAERHNMIFTGTQIVKGSCQALVVSTGMETVFGKIAGTLQTLEEQKTPMQKRLDKFSKQLGYIILGLVAIVMFLGFFNGLDKLEMFFVAVTLAIGAIPEGLPAVLAIAFSIASSLLFKENVIVRKLPAVETLGSVTVICSDKTGTITQEQMIVQSFFYNNKEFSEKEANIKSKEFQDLLKTSVLCNDARYEMVNDKYEFLGDPTEEALVRCALDFDVDKMSLTKKQPTIQKFEFDSERKRMSKVRDNGHNNIIYTKGAPDKILDICSFEIINGEIKKLTPKRKKELLDSTKKMESKALRVLGFAYKNISKKSSPSEAGMIFQGFIGMQDPPRKEVKQAIQDCINAGIQVKIITGDSAVTARAIAKKVGIEGRIVTEDELEEMTDAQLSDSIEEIVIFARTTPHQKLRIAQILQERGHIVAMTGDGINDVLALKSADIGIAMGSRGTDVARDVSDIILVDDNFASIVDGVRQGRRTYDNIKKFTKYMLAVNFDTILLVGILSSLGMPLPITPLLILWKNLLTDSFPALSIVFEPEEDVMKSKPRQEKSIFHGITKFIIFGGMLDFFACLLVYIIGFNIKGLSVPEVQTMVATTGIIFELFFIYTCRTDRPLIEKGIFSNKWLNLALITGLGLQIALLYTPLNALFGAVPLTLNDWLFVLPFGISGLIISETVKMIKAYVIKK